MALILDVECFHDYFLICFLDRETGKTASFDMWPGKPLNVSRVAHYMRNETTISFNGNSYDLPMISAALDIRNCAELKKISDEIIKSNLPSWRVCKDMDVSVPNTWDHIDIIDVVPGQASLKVYAGRIGYAKLQELPIDPSASISSEQREDLRRYCINDLRVTDALYRAVEKQIALRVEMGAEYGVDLRSKSDAQIAETVLKSEIERASNKTLRVPKISDSATFRYLDPKIISFKSAELNDIFARILDHKFGLSTNGSIALPDWLKDTRIVIGGNEYQMGIGGLHSCEKSQSVRAGNTHILADFDVASYYPSIILQQNIAPDNMGDDFTDVYKSIVERRIAAKRAGDKVTADTLKIVVNGSFGKLGSKYSALYAPNLLIQTTITGQLALLMLIERVNAIGAKVVSANTDGIVVFAPKTMENALADVMFNWELDTSYELERSDYIALHSRDVNNYFAVKKDGSVKRKGAFAQAGLMKNPVFEIVSDAVADHLAGKSDYRKTIMSCRDLHKFVMLRKVTGGAVWRGEPIGKSVRFYYSTSVGHDEMISYAKNTNKVPQSDGAKPCLDLPEMFPSDVDFERYVGMARMVFDQIGVDYA
jgi:DNA polymerase elongation subunit (family B)